MELAAGIHAVGGQKGGHVHAFLIEDGTDLALIDTLYELDGHLVRAEIQRLGRSISDLKRIALTHAHRSHLGGLAALKRDSGATVLSHEWEADIVAGERKAQPVTILPRRPLKRLLPVSGRAGARSRRASALPGRRVARRGRRVRRPAGAPHPGHTPGHLSFYSPEQGVLLSGDAIATWPEFAAGWPAFNLNPEEQRESLRRMAALEPKVVGVGHGSPITGETSDRVHSLVER